MLHVTFPGTFSMQHITNWSGKREGALSLEWHLVEHLSRQFEIKPLSNVFDFCWSRLKENVLASTL